MDPGELPIEEARERVLAAVATGDPVVVAAPTGSGKSTRLPLWLARTGPVLVVEPRRVACRALATWLAQQRGEPVGRTIGYRVRFEDHSCADTEVLFVTPGMALAMLGDDAERVGQRFCTLLLDEFHERSWEVDLLAALARAGRFGPHASLVICSATLDTQSLVSTLGARLVTSSGRTFPVEVEHQGEGPPNDRDLESRVATACAEMLARTPGDVLVFLPGKREIERCRAALAGVAADPIAVHGGVPPRVLTDAFSPSARRRVFVATNVAETSLTIPSVTAVVDSGLVRMRVHQGGRAVLAVVPVSAASMQQRAGRAGRVGPGVCVRLWSPRFEPDTTTPPEVARIELDDVLLRAGLCGLEPADVADAPWITPLPGFAVAAARARLEALGAIDGDGQLTEIGAAQAALPVSWLGARILAEAPAELAGALADIVAVVEVGRDLLLPLAAVRRPDAVDEARGELFVDALDEVEVQRLCLRDGAIDRHGLHPTATREARRLADQLRRRIGVAARSTAPERSRVVAHLLRRAPEAVFVPRARVDKRKRSSKRAWSNGRCELALSDYPIPSRRPESQPDPAVAGIVLDWEWLGRGRGAHGVGRLMLRCTLDELVEAGVGEIAVGAATYERKRVVAPVERVFAGIVLSRRTEPLRGAALCAALADLILRGAAFRDFGHALLDALHRWDLLGQGGHSRDLDLDGPPADRVAYVGDRLHALGVEQTRDFQLVGPEDLVPALREKALAAGIPPRELDALFEDFPRRFSVPGGSYVVSVQLRRKLVVVEPADSRTKREPAARFVPRFRGFSVEFHKASRIVRVR